MVRLLEQDWPYLMNAAHFPEQHDHDAPLPVRLTFPLTAAESEAAWPRVGEWLSQQAQVQVRARTDRMVESVQPAGRGFHYAVERSRATGDAECTVTCAVVFGSSPPPRAVARQADKHCHFLAWHLKSGESRPSRVSAVPSD